MDDVDQDTPTDQHDRAKELVAEGIDVSFASPIWDKAKRYRYSNGYYFRQFFDHCAERSRRRTEHILIWERVHGRRVPRNCHIHHRDLDRSNNSAENLLCIPIALHKELHSKLQKAQEAASTLAFEVERQRITEQYERKAADLLELWELLPME